MGRRTLFAAVLGTLFCLSGGGWPVLAKDSERSPVRVVLFSQTYCASCAVLKKYFDEHGVVYTEFNISNSPVAKDYFDRLGGRGTPLLVVGSDVMQVFDSARFWRLYSPDLTSESGVEVTQP